MFSKTIITVRGLAIALIALSLFSTGAYAAGDEPTAPESESASLSLRSLAMSKLEKKAFTLGLAYTQVTYKSTHPDALRNTQITDNGAPSLIIELNSSEKKLVDWPMVVGSAIIGWDINASAGFFDTRYQLVNSAFRGEDIGTHVSGGYIGVAPTLFLKMGPLYPGRDIYWKVGYGIGPGLFKGSGTALFKTTTGDMIADVGSSSAVFAIYNNVSWQFQVDNWYFDIMGKWLSAQDGHQSSLESYGFGLAYRFKF